MATRKPTFLDEPIQWHLSTTAHDHCPYCGADLANMGARRRTCLGRCSFSFTLKMSPKAFLEMKMQGLQPVDYEMSNAMGAMLPLVPGAPMMSLAKAQKESLDGIARVPVRMAASLMEYAFWPKGALEPHDDPETIGWSQKKKEVIRAGTPLWRSLLLAKTWQPNKPKNVLDKLIDDDDSAKLIRRPRAVRG